MSRGFCAIIALNRFPKSAFRETQNQEKSAENKGFSTPSCMYLQTTYYKSVVWTVRGFRLPDLPTAGPFRPEGFLFFLFGRFYPGSGLSFYWRGFWFGMSWFSFSWFSLGLRPGRGLPPSLPVRALKQPTPFRQTSKLVVSAERLSREYFSDNSQIRILICATTRHCRL